MQVTEVGEFVALTVRRRGGIMGVDSTLRVDSTMAGGVDHRHSNSKHAFQLDARAAEDLLHAMTQVVSGQPGASPTDGPDLPRYDIEIEYRGTTYTVSSVDLGADEALHGLMMLAERLMTDTADGINLRSTAHAAAEATITIDHNAAVAPQWIKVQADSGAVPPWPGVQSVFDPRD